MTLSNCFQEAREPAHLWEGAWVTFCHVVLALGIGLLLWKSWIFQFHDNSGIVGWVSVHKYPKYQELIAYIGGFVCVALGVVVGWFSWCILALFYANSVEVSISRSLSIITGIFSLYLLVIIPIVRALWYPFIISSYLLLAVILSASAIKIFWQVQSSSKPLDAGSDKPINYHTTHLAEIDQLGLLNSKTWWQLFIIYIIIPFLLYIYLYDGSIIHRPLDLFHEGDQLAPWNSLIRGGMPFRDIYIQHGLFEDIGRPWLATFLGDRSLAALRLVGTFLEPLGYLALYYLGLQVFSNWPWALALVLLASSQNFWVRDRHALGLLTVAMLAYGSRHLSFQQLTNRSNICILASGILTTLAFFYSVDMGLYAFTACAVTLCILGLSHCTMPVSHRWLPLVFYVTGSFIALIPFAISFGLINIISNTYIQCASLMPAWGLPFPPFLTLLQDISSRADFRNFVFETLPSYIPVIVYLIVLGVLLFRWVRKTFWNYHSNIVLFLVLLLGVAQFNTALGRSDSRHIVEGSTVFWVFILVALEGIFTYYPRWLRERGDLLRKLTVSFLGLLVLGLSGWYFQRVYSPIQAQRERAGKLIQGKTFPRTVTSKWERIGGLKLEESQLLHLHHVVDFIQQNTMPNEAILDFSNQGAFYFLAERPSVTRFPEISFAAMPSSQYEIIRNLEQSHTKLIIYSTGGPYDKMDGIPNSERVKLIANFIQANFAKKVDIDGTILLIR